MKHAILEIAPELAPEAFALLRDSGAVILGTTESSPVLRVVVSHELLPPECEPGPRWLIPVVMMIVKSEPGEAGQRHRLAEFKLNPWAAPDRRRR